MSKKETILTFNEVAAKAHLKKLSGELYPERRRAYEHALAAYRYIYADDNLDVACIDDSESFIKKYAFSPNSNSVSLITKMIDLDIVLMDYSIQDKEAYDLYVNAWEDLYSGEYDIYQKVSKQIIKDFESHIKEIKCECVDDAISYR